MDAVETDDEDEDACVRVFGMARARDEDCLLYTSPSPRDRG